jgi:hypothetical protein
MIIKIICLFIFTIFMAALNSVLHENYNFEEDDIF